MTQIGGRLSPTRLCRISLCSFHACSNYSISCFDGHKKGDMNAGPAVAGRLEISCTGRCAFSLCIAVALYRTISPHDMLKSHLSSPLEISSSYIVQHHPQATDRVLLQYSGLSPPLDIGERVACRPGHLVHHSGRGGADTVRDCSL